MRQDAAVGEGSLAPSPFASALALELPAGLPASSTQGVANSDSKSPQQLWRAQQADEAGSESDVSAWLISR